MKFIPDKRIAENCMHLSKKFGFLLKETASGMPEYKGATGWMDPYSYCSENSLNRIEGKAREIRAESDVFVIIGVGGSNNAARSIIEASTKAIGTPRILYAGTSTSPSAIERIIDEIDGKSVHINIIAKNFQTLEPGASFRILRKLLYEKYGSNASHRISATGTPGSKLEQLSKENGWEFFIFPEDVGGRFSMFTDVTLLPLAVAGIDVRKYLSGASKQRSLCLSLRPEENPCLLYAAARHILSLNGSKAEVLSIFEPRLQFFLKWWVQLFGESEGKNGEGLLPTGCLFSEELHSMGQFLQDGNTSVFETFLDTMESSPGPSLDGDGIDDGFDYLNGKTFSHLNNVAKHATELAHAKHIPCNILSAGMPNEETFGEMFMFFSLACVFSCVMKGINPFNQPGVEEYKAMMFAELKKE